MTYTSQQENESKQEGRFSLCLMWSLTETDILESAISWSLRAVSIWLSPGKMYLCTSSTVLLLVTSEFL